jgi:GT2 family glycosyltransferase
MLLNIKQFNEIGFFDSNFFIYLEEIDLCRRLKEKGKKIYLDKNIKINHVGGSSHNESINFEMELSRNWHWMWSLFYYNRKHFGYLNSLIKVSKKFFSSFIKMIFFAIICRRKQRKIYFQRFSGLFNSIIGKKSWYRPKIL